MVYLSPITNKMQLFIYPELIRFSSLDLIDTKRNQLDIRKVYPYSNSNTILK